jgi:hypothetical protein
MDPKRSAVRTAMQKQATVNNVYEAITKQMLMIANQAAVDPITPAKADTSYGYAGAHIEGEIDAHGGKYDGHVLNYALDVYWTGRKVVVTVMVFGPDDHLSDDSIEFSGRTDSKDVAKKAQALLYRLRGR